jgi:hypothetical protein
VRLWQNLEDQILLHIICVQENRGRKELGNGKMMFITSPENRKLKWHVYSPLVGEKG